MEMSIDIDTATERCEHCALVRAQRQSSFGAEKVFRTKLNEYLGVFNSFI